MRDIGPSLKSTNTSPESSQDFMTSCSSAENGFSPSASQFSRLSDHSLNSASAFLCQFFAASSSIPISSRFTSALRVSPVPTTFVRTEFTALVPTETDM